MKKWYLKNTSLFFIILLFSILFIVFNILSFLSDGSYIGGDTYVRYMLSRYAYQYPGNFLYHWGKPIYIALASPFAQFGYTGFKLFNIITGLLTALFAYLISKKLRLENAWLVILFVCFSPIFYMMVFTGMTEIFFGFIIMLSIYFVAKDKYILSAFILSFLPIIRNEGIAIWILFIALYTIRKQYKAMPFLLTGFLFYSVCGLFYFKDFFWLINQNPYKPGGTPIYGHGEWYFYFTNLKLTLGIPLTVLFVPGMFAVFNIVFFKNKFKTILINKETQLVVLILGVFFTYFTVHSILWWKGWMSVLGDARFMAAVTPFAAIIGLKGFNSIINYFKIKRDIIIAVSILIGIFFIRNANIMYPMPVHLGGTDIVIRDASDWIKKSNIPPCKTVYWDPFLPVALDLNPYDNSKSQSYIWTVDAPEKDVVKGDIIVWDAHYAANEGNLPLKKLLDNPNFILLKSFKPEQPITVLGGFNYEVYIFQRN